MSQRRARLLQQEDLVPLSSALFDLAHALGGEDLSHDMEITGLERNLQTGELQTRYSPKEEPYSPIDILLTLRELDNYRGLTFEASRRNVELTARLGAYATREIYERSRRLNKALSDVALKAIREALEAAHAKMGNALLDVGRPRDSAHRMFQRAGSILAGETTDS